ncbi:HEAT repeat-containing protein 4 [Hypomesus transpacificus]|uniref:HEAT repeat-containing protein 4 n=1 Tax=Hypomesus transpacificus TaxID=137520 RepID=UPI001F07A3A0|nr:HEAT repeat-containing protein 4 [Hypomesus transpacificus]
MKLTKAKGRCLKDLQSERLYKQHLHNATCGLTFSREVIKELAAETIPYNQTDFHWLFSPSGPLAPATRVKTQARRAVPISLGITEEKAFPGPRSPLPLIPMSQTTQLTAKVSFTLPTHQQGGMLDSFKRTGLRGISNVYNCLKEASTGGNEDRSKSCHWDEFVLKKLTKTTAQWIVCQQIPNQCQNKTKLQSLLRTQYGSASATDLVKDDPMSEKDFSGYQEHSTQAERQQFLPISRAETPLPVYYRVQGYSVSPACADEPGSLNQTATTVAVKHMETPLPPRLQDSLNPRAGSHVLHTENNFELELFSGIAKQVHQRDPRNHDRIIMDNNSEYQKNLQELFPCTPEKWTKPSTDTQTDSKVMYMVEKGMRRWVDLPTSADYTAEMGLQPPDYSGQYTKESRERPIYQPMPELSSLRYAVEEWKSAWKIKTPWQSVTIEGLERALTDLHCNIRLAAIVSCASGAVNRPRVEPTPIDAGLYGRLQDIQPIPQSLQPLLLQALDDPDRRVQIAAAVCQYAMGNANAHAQEILHNTIHQDSTGLGADSWVAAQCLAMDREHSRPVIQRLLSQLFQRESHSNKEQAASLLASISSKTTLVRSLLAEELNCANWKTRFLACTTISKLKGPINKDLTNKLIYLMWNDWNRTVRQTAAHALGKLGMGREVHNELRVKLEEGPASWKVEALVLVGTLQIMTVKLLPIFLRCLQDDFVVVRKQACLTAATLMMKDEMVFNQLIQMMENDPAWEVKVVAIKALGMIGCLTPTLNKLLLWALHYEEEPRVRVAACEVLKVLKVKSPELQHLLQERFVLEPHPHVHRHIEGLLQQNGYSLEGDKGMFHKIKNQVNKLSSKSIIIDKLLLMEELENMHQQHRGLVGNHSQPDARLMSQLLQEHYRGGNYSNTSNSQVL